MGDVLTLDFELIYDVFKLGFLRFKIPNLATKMDRKQQNNTK